jgi:hypothetical protein
VLYRLSYLAAATQSTRRYMNRGLRPEAGFAGREARLRLEKTRPKGGGCGGTMGSSAQDTTVFSRVLYRLSYLAGAPV